MTAAGAAVRAGHAGLDQPVVTAVLRRVLRAALARTFDAGLPVATQRRRLEAVTRLMLPPRSAAFRGATLGEVPGTWTEADGASDAGTGVLYLHGGGYCVGSSRTHRALTGHLAARTGALVYAPDYRLAPEHPCPAAIEDAVAAYRGWLALGVDPRLLVIAGDSAGGGLAVATTLRLRDEGLPLPQALVLFSPWVDLALADFDESVPGEIMLKRPWIEECARSYLGGRPGTDPRASPLYADLRGLPRTLIQAGTDEVLLPDSRRLRERLTASGVTAVFEEYPRRWHVFQANAGVLRDADRALDSVARFIAST
jgi:monoterpene epsilon-lactone hydrolase